MSWENVREKLEAELDENKNTNEEKEKKMKVLIIEDNDEHRQAAVDQLGGEYDVTAVASIDKAMVELGAYGDGTPDEVEMDSGCMRGRVVEDLKTTCEYDLVLTDLWMPAPKMERISDTTTMMWGVNMSSNIEMPGQVPAGMLIALRAAKMDIPVAILTDTTRHDGFFSAMLGCIAERGHAGRRIAKYEWRGEGVKDWHQALGLLTEPHDDKGYKLW